LFEQPELGGNDSNTSWIIASEMQKLGIKIAWKRYTRTKFKAQCFKNGHYSKARDESAPVIERRKKI
jgi:metal-dependent amidase/aminoacylase/carboxypeptidase family protein